VVGRHSVDHCPHKSHVRCLEAPVY
jgi:hypothetical protein